MPGTLTDVGYEELEEAVGPENATREPSVLDCYAFQSFSNIEETAPWVHRPVAVVLPGSTKEVQAVVRACNRNGLKFKAFSTGWGAHAGPGTDGVVQVDLRRMNRIIDIDEKNMYAIIEPYAICAQVQAEVLKKGMNLHIVGAGCGTSPLASCTSMDGTGWSGLTTGYNCRNVLGVEWVLPSGEVLTLGSPGSGLGWFSGDGPGPSLRGIMRGFFGARSGIGIFTRIAVKLYNWPGPEQPEVVGTLDDLEVEVPDNFKTYLCIFPSFEAYANAAYMVGDNEIGYMLCKNSIGLVTAIFAPRLIKKLNGLGNLAALFNGAEHMFQFMIAASSPGELDYQETVLREIIDSTNGVLVDLSLVPPMHGMVWWGFVRGALPPLSFRTGGTMGTSFGTCESFDNAVNQSRIAARLKRKYIDRGGMFEDFADNAWGGVYEGTGHYGHQEELILFDARNPEHVRGVREYEKESAETTRDQCFGLGLGVMAFSAHFRDEVFGDSIYNYPHWQKRIKEEFDEGDAADSSFYI